MNNSVAQFYDFTSTPNPNGSGARALGMGGAYIGGADDATAASWNPGCLINLQDSGAEFSIVFNGKHLIEKNNFGSNPGSSNTMSVSDETINYCSIVYPFQLFKRNMVISLNYQNLYDFNREWDFPVTFTEKQEMMGSIILMQTDETHSFDQSGMLSALGLAYCIQIIPKLSFGLTLNFWNDDFTQNKWEQKYAVIGTNVVTPPDFPQIPSEPIRTDISYNAMDSYSFNGFNVNLGLMYRVNSKLSIGTVFKSPFTADIDHKIKTDEEPEIMLTEKLKMPMSYGIGFSYRLTDYFSIAGDIYKTKWQDFIYTDHQGNDISFVTGKNKKESDIKSTYQVRIGSEYLLLNQNPTYIIPVRAGIFYDPAPAQGSPDDYYGFSVGTGLTIQNIAFDIAFQYRTGNDVGESTIINYDNFSQDIREYLVYSSFVVYLK